MRQAASLLVFVLLLTSGCAFMRAPAVARVAPDADLSIYRSWEWDTPRGPAAPELDALIRDTITRELAVRGYHQVDGHWPEMRVGYSLATVREIELQHVTPASELVHSYTNASQSYEVTSFETSVRVFETGSLMVSVALASDGSTAWQATQSRRARRSFARVAAQSVSDIFRTFPAESRPPLPTEMTEEAGRYPILAVTPD